ncbi:peptide chain release factor N(5)-glutamine methyltransferase [Pelotomaculum propionicicum]|uniref:Release factor glutamine methyltransferase n=1 Tax=Pelotomaculum propionicicum TaxID=258475 RepID=A0A4Y7RXS3_9FIRM|nr:peptide chain release factor N(5)-glutamine methyltransferase [Pelotomaculum propionicicum]TEB13643.1 Release factor glutamine methyltransferase [Pelotomaculum propionicicum]
MAITFRSALRQAVLQFKEAGSDSPDLDAAVLLCHVTGLDRAGVYANSNRRLSEEEEVLFRELTRRRRGGEPVAYITGRKEFMGLDFMVNRAVLIPRPETELLVETALKLMPAASTVVDVGTGSGAIAVSLAFYNPGALVYAIDCSPEALAAARRNAAENGVAGRVFFYEGSLLDPLSGVLQPGQADLVAANLPYIATGDLSALPGEVRLFEPLLALDGGGDGLEHYRRLIPQAEIYLKKGGALLFEIGFNQGRQALDLLHPSQWKASVVKDLAGLDRLVVAEYLGCGPG